MCGPLSADTGQTTRAGRHIGPTSPPDRRPAPGPRLDNPVCAQSRDEVSTLALGGAIRGPESDDDGGGEQENCISAPPRRGSGETVSLTDGAHPFLPCRLSRSGYSQQNSCFGDGEGLFPLCSGSRVAVNKQR